MSNGLINNSNITRERQHFFINNVEIPGIQSVDISYQTNSIPIKFIGMTGINYIPFGPQVGEAVVNCLLITTDQFLSLTGNSGINGYLFKTLAATGDNFSFTSGFLTNYSSSCAVGQVPQLGARFTVFGNAGRIPSSESASVVSNFQSITGHTSTLPLKIADPGSIQLSLSDANTNRVQSYDISINVPRRPNYLPGNRYPSFVDINYPIEVDVNFVLDYNDYVAKNFRDFPFQQKTNNISITLKDVETSENILTYGFSGMQLVGERYSANTDGSVKLTVAYKAYYTK